MQGRFTQVVSLGEDRGIVGEHGFDRFEVAPADFVKERGSAAREQRGREKDQEALA
ncbi:MAG: hypothetical protein AMXMBFR84_48700 [Candidatus Hydrogenedentota bacterium]